jgi:murein hydrolase activator
LRLLLGEALEPGPGAPASPVTPNLVPFKTDVLFHALKGDLPWPVRGTLVRKFGVERDPRFGTRTIQQGIEIDAFPEIAVQAVHPGRVVYADQFVGYGMLVIVDHGHREHTLYGRLGELRVAPGDDVAQGALLGLLPNTRVTGSGLHFEVRIEGRPEDPLDWLKKP